MCCSCKLNPAVAKDLCKPCYNRQYWSKATPAQLAKRRFAVAENQKQKKEGTFTRKNLLNPSKEEARLRVNDYVRQSRAKRKAWVSEIKQKLGCVDCGYNENPIALDFDHVRGEKHMGIAQAVSRCWSLEKILQEIEKCEVRCANCHRIITMQRLEKD